MISNNFNREALGATTPIFWVCPSCNYAHVLKDAIQLLYLLDLSPFPPIPWGLEGASKRTLVPARAFKTGCLS